MKLPPLMIPDHLADALLEEGLSLGRVLVTRLVPNPPTGSDTYADGSGWITVDGAAYEAEWRKENEQ